MEKLQKYLLAIIFINIAILLVVLVQNKMINEKIDSVQETQSAARALVN